jgi:TonB family protein
MSTMARHALHAVVLAAILSLAFPSISPLAQGQDGQQHLRDQYQGKMFVLRGFYSGDHLRYDASGTVIGSANPGDWMSDGFILVKEIRSSHHQLVIEAQRRLVIQLDGKQFQFLSESKPEKHELKIEADVDVGSMSPEQADAAISKIFLTPHDNLADSVSDYWKPCVREAAAGQGQTIRFSPDFLSIPGVVASEPNSSATTAETRDGQALSCNTRQRHGRGVYPRVTYQQEPEFSDQARRAKVQGVVMLMLVVNEEGVPENVRITKPLGYGLDEKALSCVQRWRFTPAEEDGRPVPMQIAVEVNFHLY